MSMCVRTRIVGCMCLCIYVCAHTYSGVYVTGNVYVNKGKSEHNNKLIFII